MKNTFNNIGNYENNTERLNKWEISDLEKNNVNDKTKTPEDNNHINNDKKISEGVKYIKDHINDDFIIREMIAPEKRIELAYQNDEIDLKIKDLAQIKDSYEEARGRLENINISEIKTKKENYEGKIIHKIKNKLKIRDKKHEAYVDMEEVYESTNKRAMDMDYKMGGIKHEIDESKHNLEMAKKAMIDSSCEPIKDSEIKEKVFNEDVLSNISTEEYIDFWKKYMHHDFFVNSTRQGLRDHGGLGEHRKGMFERHDGFKNILKSQGKMLSNVELKGSIFNFVDHRLKNHSYSMKDERTSEGTEAINNFVRKNMNIIGYKSFEKNESKSSELPVLVLNNDREGVFQDMTAVHVSHLHPPDKLYGAETNNEIFTIWPTDVVDEQCITRYRNIHSANAISDAKKHNDASIYGNKVENLNINSGIVFLPESNIVDPDTGSIYEKDATEASMKKVDKENGVNSREYWEKYFKDNNFAPAHIYWYDSRKTPSEVLDDFVKGDLGSLKGNKNIENRDIANVSSFDEDRDFIKYKILNRQDLIDAKEDPNAPKILKGIDPKDVARSLYRVASRDEVISGKEKKGRDEEEYEKYSRYASTIISKRYYREGKFDDKESQEDMRRDKRRLEKKILSEIALRKKR